MRVVAVGGQVMWSPRWQWFADFLFDYLKKTLGLQWGSDAQRQWLDHPVFRWFKQIDEVSSNEEPDTVSHEATSSSRSVLRLAYALYLIEHNDQLDASLVARLRRPQSFLAAYYETLLAAAFAVSGAKIQMAEHRGQWTRTPEFWAVGLSGRRYAVEAKWKSGWKSSIDPLSTEFRKELRQWLRDQIYRASQKRLQNAVYSFELSIPLCLDRDAWESLLTVITEALHEAESII